MNYTINEERLTAEEYIDFAVPFYEKLGMTQPNDVMVYNHIEWTDFTVE